MTENVHCVCQFMYQHLFNRPNGRLIQLWRK